MLNIIVEDNCEFRQIAIQYVNALRSMFDEIATKYQLESLKYFVIADNDPTKYRNTVLHYAKLVNTNTVVVNDEYYSEAAKCLCGVMSNGEYVQAIIVKLGILAAMYWDIKNKNTINEIGKFVLHEMGHAVNNVNIFHLVGSESKKVQYNLIYEMDEYVKQSSFSLWGEYYAETFAYGVCNNTVFNYDNEKSILIECIQNYSTEKTLAAIVERVYRILYNFCMCMAGMHVKKHRNFDYNTDEILDEYVPYLKRMENAVIALMKQYPKINVNNCMDGISEVFYDMVQHEIKK